MSGGQSGPARSAVREPELTTVLSFLVGRELRAAEVFDALGVSRSGYYLARAEGRLVSADNLLRLADAFGLNPVALLVRYGLVSDEAVRSYAEGAPTAAGGPVRRSSRLSRLRPRMDAPPI